MRPTSIALLLALAGAASVVRSQTIDAAAAKAAVEDVSAQLAQIRGLSYKSSVPVRVVDDAFARGHVTARFKKFMPEAELAATAKAWELLGVVPAGTDILKSFLDALEEQAGGFYDPETKSFFLLDDMPRGMAALLAAHELTHALEDQHYDLDARIAAAKGDDDRMFAIGAVHEGSAMAAMSVYMSRAMSSGKLTQDALQEFAKSEAGKAEKLNRMPAALRRQMIGPYLLGVGFVARGDLVSVMQKGYPTADAERFYKSGPVSSEQILHPEKYWDDARRDLPKPVSVGDAGRSLGRGWKRSLAGNLGELMVGVMVGATTPDTNDPAAQAPSAWTHVAAAGWGGDRWELWQNGDRAVALLATVWDSEKDAQEFADALAGKPGLRVARAGSRVGVLAGDAGEGAERTLAALLR
ncbi:MAG TPA: hypothetical protein VF139_11940 [Candidatus Polarisedimenticolaceae bacterium]